MNNFVTSTGEFTHSKLGNSPEESVKIIEKLKEIGRESRKYPDFIYPTEAEILFEKNEIN